jgi:hypothetical protein
MDAMRTEVLERLAGLPARLAVVAGHAAADEAIDGPLPGEWSAREVVAHLAAVEAPCGRQPLVPRIEQRRCAGDRDRDRVALAHALDGELRPRHGRLTRDPVSSLEGWSMGTPRPGSGVPSDPPARGSGSFVLWVEP